MAEGPTPAGEGVADRLEGAAGRREQAREERRQQILDAALAVFGRKGYHAANVSDVAAEAGVSQGTIYWYFDSKEELLMAALLSFFEGFGREALASVASCETATAKLYALSDILEGFTADAEGLFTLFLSYWSSSPRREEAGRVWTGLLAEFQAFIVAIIEEGVQSGEFKPVDAESLAWALMAAYDGLAAYLLLIPELDLGRTSRAFVDTLLRGLRTGGESR